MGWSTSVVARSMARAAFVVATIAACAPVLAADAPMPGLWETTSKSLRNGVATIRPARTRCISADQSRDFAARITRDFNTPLASCKSVDVRKTESGVTWGVACAGALPVSAVGGYAFDSPEHYVATIQSTVQFFGHSVQSTLTIEGKRVGECLK